MPWKFNPFSGKLDYYKAGTGTGDVVGPASATDNAITRFDGTTGHLVQNSGATIDDSGNLTATNISGTNTGNQNLFSTIAVAGQSDIVADSVTDTLTIVAGSNITLTTNASTDTLTITAAGGTGTPGGSTTQVQYNNAGAFGGISGATTDGTTTSFKDANFLVTDDSDATKKMAFQLSGITTGTTRTVTMPDASGTVTLLGNTSTGSGSVVLATSPSLTTPTIGVASATSVNKVAFTAPATSATLTIADGATLTASANATVSGTNTGDQTITLTGDVTGSGTGSFSATIANDAVTNAKMANMAQSTIKGRAVGAGTGDPTDLTATQATAILDNLVGDSGSGGTKGLAPAPASGDSVAGKFLKADGTWAVPSGGGGTPGGSSTQVQYNNSGAFGGISGATTDGATLTVKDANFLIVDDGDTTKKVAFQASSITTGTTRTKTFQDVSGTIYETGGTDVAVADGGTGASTASGARTNLGLVIGTDVQAWDADLDTWATKTAPSGTVVGNTDTQTLSNKTLDNTNTITVKDTLFTIQDNSDTTKQAVFELSGITTGTTRTMTVPDGNFTFVGTTLTQTMTDKTIGDPLNFSGTTSITSGNYQIGVNASNVFVFNVPTTRTFNWSINGTSELTLDPSTLNLQTNTITGIGSAITGTQGTALTLSIPQTTSGNGTDLTIRSGASSAGGATGGSVVLYPGAQGSSGAPGTVQVKNTSGTTIGHLTTNGTNDLFFGQTTGSSGTFSFGVFTTTPTTAFQISNTASSANYLVASGATASNPPSLVAGGSDTNISTGLSSKGTGTVYLGTNSFGSFGLSVSHTASGVNYADIKEGATGTGPTISATGTDTDINLILRPKGAGDVDLGAVGDIKITGGSNGQVLTTNGSGVLSFTTVAGGGSTFDDSAFAIYDNVDNTKQIAFQASGITTGTTRTFTAPDASGTLALTSNKLSAFAATTSAELAGVISDETGTGLLVFGTAPTFASTMTIGTAAGTTGAINFNGTTSGTVTFSVADAAGTWTMKLPTSAGTNGQLLTTDGSGNTSWTTVAGGGSTFIDNVFRIQDDGDNTKQIAFEASGITTGTTRTITMIDSDLTIVGTSTTQTLSGKTLTAPIIVSGGYIADANGNEQVKFTTTASAVNEFTITNSSSGSRVTLEATGGDTNIGMFIKAKGTGQIIVNDGTSVIPSIGFASSVGTGIYQQAANTLGITAGSSDAARFIAGQILAISGSSAAPGYSFVGGTNYGWNFASNVMTLYANAVTRFNVNSGFQFTSVASSGAAPQSFTFTGAAHTALTASTEYTSFNFNGAQTRQWNTGALSTQRTNRMQGETIGFVAASTVSEAYTLDIEAPAAGTNATLTFAPALKVNGIYNSGSTRQLVTSQGDSNLTLTNNSRGAIVFTALTATRTVTLPTIGLNGLMFTIIDGTGLASPTVSIVVDGAGSQTISGSLNKSITSPYGVMTVLAAGGASQWVIIN